MDDVVFVGRRCETGMVFHVRIVSVSSHCSIPLTPTTTRLASSGRFPIIYGTVTSKNWNDIMLNMEITILPHRRIIGNWHSLFLDYGRPWVTCGRVLSSKNVRCQFCCCCGSRYQIIPVLVWLKPLTIHTDNLDPLLCTLSDGRPNTAAGLHQFHMGHERQIHRQRHCQIWHHVQSFSIIQRNLWAH